jgi:hypothetical protein
MGLAPQQVLGSTMTHAQTINSFMMEWCRNGSPLSEYLSQNIGFETE